MKARLIARLFGLQRKLKRISIYNHENGSALFKYSIEFESLLGNLLKVDYQEFDVIANNYIRETQRYCELGCELRDEKSREEAFSTGINEMNLNVNECVKILTR